MSTGQSIIDKVQFHIDINADLIHLLNRAVNTITKRLFLLRSTLAQDELAVPVWAEVTVTADDIAFVNGTPATITSVTTDFVSAGFVVGMHISGSTQNPGPFKIAIVAANLITLISTDTVTDEVAGSDITLTSDNSYGDLPSDFWGLILTERPYVSNKRWPLEPLPDQDTELAFANQTGVPIYYKIKGTRIYVVPATGSDVTIKGGYWFKPTALTGLDSTLPYNELFDDVIAEYLLAFYEGGDKGKQATSFLESFLRENVDPIVALRERTAPKKMPGGINYNRCM